MRVFVDTSAFLALLDADDDHHPAAVDRWAFLNGQAARLFTSNYVIVETTAVVQHRLGLDAVRAFTRDLLPLVEVEFVDAVVHASATAALLAAGRRQLSLVDCSSFEMMRRAHVDVALGFDRHFSEQGFELA